MSRSGLKKVSKTVRGRKGSVRRSYWVKAQEGAKSVGQKIWHNKGKIALAGAAIAGGLYLRHRKAAYQAKDREIREAARVADFRADAIQSLRKAKLDPRRSPQQTPSFNTAQAAHYTGPPRPPWDPRNKEHQWLINHKAKDARYHGNLSGRVPLELGPGTDYKPAKPKRSRKKK
jgi:hypothetical protein